MATYPDNLRPIGVFDSGLGGLSVVRWLRELLPGEEIVYFGDTARVPYGTKSRPTVTNFALQDARFLLSFDPKLIVVACHTASALALDTLVAALPVPVIGVVAPGAQAAVKLAQRGPVAVLGTHATVGSQAYPNAIHALAPSLEVLSKACPLFVPLAEEGHTSDDPLVRLAVERYLTPLRARDPSAVVLGCTHYPLLRGAIEAFLGPRTQVVDCGHEAALAVRAALAGEGGLSARAGLASMRCYVSDNPERFRRLGSHFLQQDIENVERVDPERDLGAIPGEPVC